MDPFDDPRVEERARELARQAAEEARRLAEEAAEKAQALAVARAVRDAHVDRDLIDHSRHLAEINGSQHEMADSLAQLKDSFQTMALANEVVAKYVSEQSSRRFSKRTAFWGAAGATAAWVSIIVAVLLAGHL